MARSKLKIYKYGLLTLVSCFWLFLFEMTSTYFLENYGTPFDKAVKLLTPDKQLGWKLKTSVDTHFLGSRVETNQNGFRKTDLNKGENNSILFLGPSSMFGWGVNHSQSYPVLLASEIQKSKDRFFYADNLSVIGFSSFQGLKLVEQETYYKKEPRLVVVGYGVNDIDRHRFFFQSPLGDKQALDQPKSDIQLWAEVLTRGFSFSRLVLKALSGALEHYSCPRVLVPPPKRVSFEDFNHNISKIVDFFQRKGAQIVLVGTPHLFPRKEKTVSRENQILVDSLFSKARAFFHKGNYEDTIRALESLLMLDRKSNEAFYLKAASYSRLGECAKASEALKHAFSTEKYRINSGLRKINSQLKSVAKIKNVKYLDAHALLQRDKENFMDPVHPSVSGHEKMAQALFLLTKEAI